MAAAASLLRQSARFHTFPPLFLESQQGVSSVTLSKDLKAIEQIILCKDLQEDGKNGTKALVLKPCLKLKPQR